MYKYKRRKSRGHSIAELGPALFMVLIVMILPMACLASLAIRFTFLFYATRQAAREAAKCTQYINNQNAYQLSARNRATQIMNLFANSTGANGLRLINCQTYADIQPIGSSGSAQRYGPNSPVPTSVPISTRTNVYNYTVQVDGEIQPLINNGNGWYGQMGGGFGVPGLTRPFPVRMVSAAMCEKPEGLKF